PLAEQAPSAVCGSDLVIADGRDVVLLDGESGGELARAGTAGQVVSLGAEYDRGAALVGANRGRLPLLIGLELGRDFGRTIWKRVLPGGPLREVERRKIHGVAVGHVVVDNSSTHGYRLEDGAPSEDSSWRVCWTTVSCTTDSLASPEPKGLPELRLARDPALRFRRSQAEIAHARNLTYVLSFGRQVTQAPGGEIVLPHAQLVNFVARDDVSGRVLIDRNLEVDSLGEFGELEVVALPRAVLALVCDLGRLEIFRFESASYRPNQPT
ncbi:MAG TPA: hypothetical protein VFF73_35865, partial [Planctomycetota bacterium]|nr:hypothetical protein [Planctomycetota bacterium]